MKPCFGKRKLITWLVLGELDARREQALCAHLRICGACRRYYAEIATIKVSLAKTDAEPEAEASAAFHRSLVARLRSERSPWAWLPALRLNWRVALPAVGAAAVLISLLAVLPRQAPPSSPVRVARAVPAPIGPPGSLPPTIGNYQRVASQSLEELDDLLTRQADVNPPPAPTSVLALVAIPD
jgi:anti-sigma factor RsiW